MQSHQTPTKTVPLSDTAYFAASGIAGVISHCIAHPISTVVSRLQISPQNVSQLKDLEPIVFGNLKQGDAYLKTRSLYSGFWIGGAYRVSTRTLRYGGQPVLAAHLATHYTPWAKQYFNDEECDIFFEATAGAMMAAVHVLVFAPLDTIKTKKQNYNCETIQSIVLKEKWNLYNGSSIFAALLKDIPKALTLFGTSTAVLAQLKKYNEKNESASLSQHLVSAMAGATANVFVSNPQSVVKARLQNQTGSLSTFAMFKKTLQEEGYAAFYKGIGVRLLLAIPEKVLPLALAGYLISSWKKSAEAEDQKVKRAAFR